MSRSTQTNLETSLADVAARERDFETACQDDADAEHAFKIKQAKQFMAAEGTEKARASQALIDCEREHKDHLTKKAVKEFTREKLRDSQNALSARQSLLNFDAKTNFGYTQMT